MPSGPKNQKFMNRHAAEAQERDRTQAANAKAQKAQAKEDAEWADVDKATLRTQQRQAEADAKREADLARRAENKELYETENRASVKANPTKVSKRAQQKDMAKLLASYDKEMEKARPTIDTEEKRKEADAKKANAGKNVRPEEAQLDRDEAKQKKKNAHNKMDATEATDDRVIGKRAKALYRKFEEDNMDEVKKDRPGLRRTQYKDVLWELWQKSPSNPFVQRAEARAAEAVESKRSWMQNSGSDDEDDQ